MRHRDDNRWLEDTGNHKKEKIILLCYVVCVQKAGLVLVWLIVVVAILDLWREARVDERCIAVQLQQLALQQTVAKPARNISISITTQQ